MSTPKVGPRPSAAAKLVKPTAATPKASFAETLSAKTGGAETKVVEGRAKPAPDPREQQLLDVLGQQLTQSAQGMAKEAKLEEDDAKGGLDDG